MRLDLVGPAAFRKAFGATRIGALLGSEEGAKLWRPLLEPVEKIWRRWDGQRQGFATTRDRVLAYGGRIRVLWLVQPGDDDQRDLVCGIYAMDTDGETDLSALAGDLSRAMQSIIPVDPRAQQEQAARAAGPGGGGARP